jgi:hypothetical protein
MLEYTPFKISNSIIPAANFDELVQLIKKIYVISLSYHFTTKYGFALMMSLSVIVFGRVKVEDVCQLVAHYSQPFFWHVILRT